MTKKQKLIVIGLLLLIVLVVLPGFIKRRPSLRSPISLPGKVDRGGYGQSVHPEIEFMNVPQECQEYDFTEFTNHITDPETVTMVVPPGTFDTYHGERIIKTHAYIVGQGERPIYAPTDSIAFEGVKYSEEGMVQYSVFFMADCDLMFMFDHIQKPVAKLLSEIEAVDNLASEDSRTSPFRKVVRFESGELIGYSSGTRDAKHWDFGTYDLTDQNFLKDADVSNATGRNNYATCPFDYFPPEMAKQYISKFGNLRTEEAVPETFCKRT